MAESKEGVQDAAATSDQRLECEEFSAEVEKEGLPSIVDGDVKELSSESDERGERELLEGDSARKVKEAAAANNGGLLTEEQATPPPAAAAVETPCKSFLLDANDGTGGDESGTEEDQAEFMKELDTFHRERFLEFKPPKFYQEPLNCLKLWRAVVRLGGYEQVTSLKLWRQVGESFRPPKPDENCDRIELYRKTHQNEKGWSSAEAELNWEIMVANQYQYEQEGIEMTEDEIVAEVLGPANGYVKGLGYGPKPPGKSSSSNSNNLQQLLDETRDELNESRSEAATFKSKVDTLTDQLKEQSNQVKEQAACIAELMAFMKSSGHKADKGPAESDSD